MKSIAEYMEDGKNVERYLSVTVCDENCRDVTNNDNYPGVDFLIYKEE